MTRLLPERHVPLTSSHSLPRWSLEGCRRAMRLTAALEKPEGHRHLQPPLQRLRRGRRSPGGPRAPVRVGLECHSTLSAGPSRDPAGMPPAAGLSHVAPTGKIEFPPGLWRGSGAAGISPSSHRLRHLRRSFRCVIPAPPQPQFSTSQRPDGVFAF